MTLRQLVWMARGRQRFAGDVAAWHACMLIARLPFTAKVLDPRDVNPYRDEDPAAAEQMEKLRQWQAGRTWDLLHSKR